MGEDKALTGKNKELSIDTFLELNMVLCTDDSSDIDNSSSSSPLSASFLVS